MEMDEETKGLVKEVGTAINESVRDSAAVAVAIQRLREAGFEMELSLKLEIALRLRQKSEEEESSKPSLELTEEDLGVLRSMKIKFEPQE